ncbi:MAG: hypothetical protein ACKOBW_01535, partial [Planctomycetota bacterium]
MKRCAVTWRTTNFQSVAYDGLLVRRVRWTSSPSCGNTDGLAVRRTVTGSPSYGALNVRRSG